MVYGTRNGTDFGFYFDNEKNSLKSSVDITDGYYNELFDGQANGKAISRDEDGKPILVEPETLLTDEQKTEIATNEVQAEINTRLSAINSTENRAKAFIDDDFKEEMISAIKAVLSVKEQEGYPSVVSWTDIPDSL